MNTWDKLSMAEKAEVMRLAVAGGVYDLDTIRDGYNEFAEGGHTIHIKPENRGKFTALKERTGHSATWFKEHGTPAQKKMAIFDLNSRHWKHGDGGYLFGNGGGITSFWKKKYNEVLKVVNPKQARKEAIERGRERYSGYIGGSKREARQMYFNRDEEFTDSVNSISQRYGLNPSVVASRIAEEGAIDEAINAYNNNNTQGIILSDDGRGTWGPLWGLDDFNNRINNNQVTITTSSPYTYNKVLFENEKGRVTESVKSPQWWFGIEATAAELKARRDKMKENNPWMDDRTLDAAASFSFNYGEDGAQKFIKEKKYVPKRYNPYIKTGK